MSLMEALARASRDMDDDSPAILPEAAIMRLKEAADRYIAGNPFKVGDIVTPRPGMNVAGAGKPHVVIAVRADPQPVWDGEPGSNAHGMCFDIRVASISGRPDRVMAHWCESWSFQPFTAA